MALKFVQAVLRHNLAPSKVNNLLKCIRAMRSEIQRCLRKLDNTFQHVWNLYTATTNGLTRIASCISDLSTSTALTARIKLVARLKDFEDTWRLARQRKVAAQVLSPNGVSSSAEDKEARERRFSSFAPLSPDAPDTPQSPVMTDPAGRLRFAQIIRKAGALLDPGLDSDPEQFNNRVFREGRYRTYPRTPGEENLNPHLRKHEEQLYQARGAGPSQISLVSPGTPNAQASGSGSQTPRPDST